MAKLLWASMLNPDFIPSKFREMKKVVEQAYEKEKE